MTTNRERQASVSVPERICKWPFSDPWGGASMTEGRARAEAHYASQMYSAAMLGRLENFDQPKRTAS